MSYLPYKDINVWTYVSSLLNLLIPIAGAVYS